MSLKYSNILVAVDGSKESELAFKKGAAAAARNNATLHLAHIIDNRSFGSIEAYDRTIADRTKKTSQELLTKYKEEAIAAGVENVNVIVEYGIPKIAIPKELAPKLNADVIICGATGLNAAERFIMGSVSERIVRTAKCDVLIVRREQADVLADE
ncbi:nucleotide-binding protein, UspA family [Planococcus antarcticus DSM 14505]|uniref:Universal stress protein n=1 Tax=Planococcus antarcticus DSM 14505 TaxID=1185653 RepID=A0A1C7DDI5_9BACL|nr:universal stress protein [Planococcus antarcticus]ANU09546.1 universal stress protein UspA [Planococcus antarcticus DSM 14505]EIM08253.1 nucleotide-binding protein, UspA family [Planococcus antarcticus DSM 14505]